MGGAVWQAVAVAGITVALLTGCWRAVRWTWTAASPGEWGLALGCLLWALAATVWWYGWLWGWVIGRG